MRRSLLVAGLGLAALAAVVLVVVRPPSAGDAGPREAAGTRPSVRPAPPRAAAANRPGEAPALRGESETGAAPATVPLGEAGPRARARTGVAARGSGGAADSGSIRGRARVPERLRTSLDRLAIHVTRSAEGLDGSARESWEVAYSPRDDGGYSIEDLPPGDYAVQFVLDGRGASETRRVRLEGGRAADGVDFDFVREPRVRGTVRAAGEGPALAGALVRVGGEAPETTDASGSFVLSDLAPGTHELVVTHPDHAPARVLVRVPAAGAAPAVTVDLDPGAQVRVSVVDAHGRPAPGVIVMLSSPTHVASGTTDKAGSVLVGGLAPGVEYRVRTRVDSASARAPPLVPELFVVPDLETVADVTALCE